jgi:hypothetical protein
LLIAGPSSVGKSTAAADLGRTLGRPWFAVDDLRLAVQQLVPDPVRAPFLHYFERTPDVWSRPVDEAMAAFVGIAEFLRPGIGMIARNHLAIGEDIVIEGDGLLPAMLDAPDLAEARANGRLAMVVVSPSTPDVIRAGWRGAGRDRGGEVRLRAASGAGCAAAQSSGHRCRAARDAGRANHRGGDDVVRLQLRVDCVLGSAGGVGLGSLIPRQARDDTNSWFHGGGWVVTWATTRLAIHGNVCAGAGEGASFRIVAGRRMVPEERSTSQ